jgi:hypothetical protein
MDTSSKPPPRMTVIAITPDCYETIRQTVRHLAAQAIAGEIELLIGIASPKSLNEVAVELQPFHSWRVVGLGQFDTMGAAKAIVVKEARAPFIIFAEDHSFPEPNWAAALLEAHAAGHCAAGPQVQNANPRSMLSWADLFLGFAPWIAPTPPGVRDRLPAHNTGYDRDLLLSLGEDLTTMLDNEGLLHLKLRAQGRTLFLAEISTRHANVSLFSSFLRVQYHGGRSFGGARILDQHWPWPKRLVYVCGAPLVPLLRLRRTLKQIKASGHAQALLPKMLPALFIGLCAHATGEAMGTAFGAGNSVQRKADFEFHRDHHVREADKEVWAIRLQN